MLAVSSANRKRYYNDLILALEHVFGANVVKNSPVIEQVVIALNDGDYEPFMAWLGDQTP